MNEEMTGLTTNPQEDKLRADARESIEARGQMKKLLDLLNADSTEKVQRGWPATHAAIVMVRPDGVEAIYVYPIDGKKNIDGTLRYTEGYSGPGSSIAKRELNPDQLETAEALWLADPIKAQSQYGQDPGRNYTNVGPKGSRPFNPVFMADGSNSKLIKNFGQSTEPGTLHKVTQYAPPIDVRYHATAQVIHAVG